MKNLTAIRKQIDITDVAIVTLLAQRMSLTREVAEIKNEKTSMSFTNIKREEAISTRLQNLTNDFVLKDSIADVYQTLFQSSKSIRHLACEPVCPFSTIGIIGDGLIGRSIAKVVLHKSKDAVQLTILNHDWTPRKLASCDLIIIATPINSVTKIARLLHSHRNQLAPGAIIIDVASVKKHISHVFARLNFLSDATEPSFVPTHPMGGRHERGARFARATLFAGRPWILTPTHTCDTAVKAKTSQFARYCGSIPVFMDAEEHDKRVAYISHFPGVISKLLWQFVSARAEESLPLASSGFEMMTKIGKTTNTRMRSQIAQSNKTNIQPILKAFAKHIENEVVGK